MVVLDMLVIPELNLQATVDMVRFLESHHFNCAWIADSPPLDWPDVKIRAMQKAGVRRVALFPSGRDRRGAMELFVQAVLPRLQGETA